MNFLVNSEKTRVRRPVVRGKARSNWRDSAKRPVLRCLWLAAAGGGGLIAEWDEEPQRRRALYPTRPFWPERIRAKQPRAGRVAARRPFMDGDS